MSLNLNNATIAGRLTKDPETKVLESGTSITSFSLATNRTWADKDGNKQEEVQFHNVVVFGRQAENCAKYLGKGHEALIEGRIQTRSWESDDGTKHYRTEIVAERVQFGAKPDGGGSSESDQADDEDVVEVPF